MILDKELALSEEQAVTSTAISTNVVDLAVDRNIGNADNLYVIITCDEAATAAGAATVTFSLESDSTADLATSATVHATSSAIGKATLVAGYEVAKWKLPVEDYERYLGVRYTVATGPLTAGKFSAHIVRNVPSYKAYADGSDIQLN